MRILSYSPSVEVYVAANRNGVMSYYDLTQDVTNCNVSRSENAIAECTINLQNKNDKYSNLFMPMDLITVYATKKGHRFQLFTGYIYSVSRMRLYPNDFELKCKCSLYRMQKLYWDKGLVESERALGYANGIATWDTVLVNLLVGVVGMDMGMIAIGSMPQDVVDWVRELYAAKADEANDFASDIDEFYKMLESTNAVAGISSSASSSSGIDDVLGSGKTIKIPSDLPQLGLSDWDATWYIRDWALNQAKIFEKWKAAGSVFKNGVAMLDDRYLVATMPRFGDVGSKLDIKVQDIGVLHCIQADVKGSDALNEWGHDVGDGRIKIVEFETEVGWRIPSAWEWKKVLSITNCGSIL